MKAVDVATAETLRFIEKFVSLPSSRVLEVGCGDGELAKAMQDRGASVLAIDARDEAVQATKRKGVEAREVDFITFKDEQEAFDAVVFARSFHHISPLSVAVQNAFTALKSGGTLILEEFAAEDMDEQTIDWLKRWRDLLDSNNQESHAHHHAYALGSLSGWRSHHLEKHQVAGAKQMLEAIGHKFVLQHRDSGAYLYRYLLDHLHEDVQPAARLKAALQEEQHAIDTKQIRPIGLRIVASPFSK